MIPFRPVTIISALAALVVASAAVVTTPTPVDARSVSVTLTPQNEKGERALRRGIKVYNMIRGFKNRNRASTDQRGEGNTAGITQNGNGNAARIVQRGRGHQGSITQNGNDNSHLLFQFGRNGRSNVTQNGNGRSGVTFQVSR